MFASISYFNEVSQENVLRFTIPIHHDYPLVFFGSYVYDSLYIIQRKLLNTHTYTHLFRDGHWS